MKDNFLERESGLHRGLSKNQLTMIGLGGAIGTGLFMGSALAISYAGPGVIVSYVIAAFLAVIMMYSLSEMAVAHPTAGSFGVYAEKYLGGWAGFTSRWTYWAAQVIAVGGEAVAVGIYMTYWFPGIPVWVWTLGFGAASRWDWIRNSGIFPGSSECRGYCSLLSSTTRSTRKNCHTPTMADQKNQHKREKSPLLRWTLDRVPATSILPPDDPCS